MDHAATLEEQPQLPLKSIQGHQLPGMDQSNGFSLLAWVVALEYLMEIGLWYDQDKGDTKSFANFRSYMHCSDRNTRSGI